jgi:hypothetical protein
MTADVVIVPLVRKAPRSGKIAISEIEIGERTRKDLGDLTDLKQSIQDIGALIQPIVLGPGNKLLCGARRLEAGRQLGWTEIDYVRSIDRDDAISLLKAERDENVCRKPMTPSELVTLGRRLEELERPNRTPGKRNDLTSTSVGVKVTGQARNNPTDTVVSDALGLSNSWVQSCTVLITMHAQGRSNRCAHHNG